MHIRFLLFVKRFKWKTVCHVFERQTKAIGTRIKYANSVLYLIMDSRSSDRDIHSDGPQNPLGTDYKTLGLAKNA